MVQLYDFFIVVDCLAIISVVVGLSGGLEILLFSEVFDSERGRLRRFSDHNARHLISLLFLLRS